jgi:hypothetical protein
MIIGFIITLTSLLLQYEQVPLLQIMSSLDLLQKAMADALLFLCGYSSSLSLCHKYYSLHAQKGMSPLLFLVPSKQPYGCTTLQRLRMDNNGLDYPLILHMRQESVIKRKLPTSLCSNSWSLYKDPKTLSMYS